MKGKMLKSVLAVLLALTMVLGAALSGGAAVCASAASPYAGKKYVSFGDSNATGYGLGRSNYRGFEYGYSKSAYPNVLAKKLGAKLTPLSRNGFRTTELRYMLDYSFAGDSELFGFCVGTTRKILDSYRPVCQKEAAAAALITIHVGGNDCFNSMQRRITQSIEASTANPSVLKRLATLTNNVAGSTAGLVVSLLELADEAGVYSQAAAAAMSGLLSDYAAFRTNFDALVARIYALNPDVKLVVVGMFNPVKTLKLNDIDPLPIGRAGDFLTQTYNAYMQSGSAYAGRYTYVDITDTEIYTIPTVQANPKLDSLYMHPMLKGHKYIAEQIYAAI